MIIIFKFNLDQKKNKCLKAYFRTTKKNDYLKKKKNLMIF